MKNSQKKTPAWDRYWQANRIASCAGRPGENYKPELLLGWREFFQVLDDGARILDLCTGNGAIPLVAVEVARKSGRLFHVTAVDRADVAPARFLPDHYEALQTIDFIGRTDVLAMNFEDASFDAVTSQYGIEYADHSRAADQIARLLAPNGHFRAVMHAREGHTVRAARRDIPDCRYLLEESHLFEAARAAIEVVWRHDQGEGGLGADATAHYTKYVAIHQQVTERASRANNPSILASSTSVLADTYSKRAYFPLDVLLAKVDEAEIEVQAHLGRIEEMVEASLTETDVQGFVEALGGSGLNSTEFCGEFSGEAGAQIGWVVSARKA